MGHQKEEVMHQTPERKFQIPKDLEADAIEAVSRFFKEFEKEHGFSEAETTHVLLTKNVSEKIFVIHERFKLLIAEHAEAIHEAHQHHTISFEKIPLSDNWTMTIHAECLELYFLMRILNSVLKRFETEKAKKIIQNKLAIKKALNEITTQDPKMANIVSHIWYKKGFYFTSININGAKIILKYENVDTLKNKITEALPPMMKIIMNTRRK